MCIGQATDNSAQQLCTDCGPRVASTHWCVRQAWLPWHQQSSDGMNLLKLSSRSCLLTFFFFTYVYFFALVTKILQVETLHWSYWSNFSHVTLDIISYFTRRGISNVQHIFIMSNGKNVTLVFSTSNAEMRCWALQTRTWCKLACSSFFIFRLHQMHEMQTIVTDVRDVCLSVGLSVTQRAPTAYLRNGWS